jgi:hypothetical protein
VSKKNLDPLEVVDRFVKRAESAVAAELPPYQILGELRKLKAEVEAEASGEPLPVEAAAEPEPVAETFLADQIDAVKKHDDADALAKELGITFPDDVKTVAEKVAYLHEQTATE